MKKVWFMLAMLVCVLASCSGGGEDDPITPTPKPEVIKSEITIDSSIITNGLSFTHEKGEQSISFSTNENWTLSVASTTSGVTWCTASSTSGTKGTVNVKFTVTENADYDNRSVSVTIKSGTASKTFTISQKCADALLVTTDKYEVSQDGGIIDIEVKANIEYKMEISEEAKDWITEFSGRGLTPYKHTLNISMNEEKEKRQGEVYFKSGDKVETVTIYQAGGAILLLLQDECHVSDKGSTISVNVQSNIEFGVQMPDVDWIVDEASSRGLSSHTLKYVIKANEGYDSRFASIVFFDKNSSLKDTLNIVQAQKDAIVVSEKAINVDDYGGVVEVKLNANVDFEVEIPSDVTWITKVDSRAFTEKSFYLKIAYNPNDEARSASIQVINNNSQLSETIVITQQGQIVVATLNEAGTLKSFLGNDYLDIEFLRIIGPINGDDIYCLRKMLGAESFSEADRGSLKKLDLSETFIVKGGEWYYDYNYTSKNVIGEHMFRRCQNLQYIVLPNTITSIGAFAFYDCDSLISVEIPDGVSSIDTYAFYNCNALISIDIPNSVISMGSGVFGACSSLISVKLPNGITTISDYTFSNCYVLSMIDIPQSVTSIGNRAFNNCDALTSISISDCVTSIGDEAFYNCSSLSSVNIGNGIKSLGERAFRECYALTSFYCYATNPPKHGGYVFEVFGKKTTLYVPIRCGDKYKSSDWGYYFKNIKEME